MQVREAMSKAVLIVGPEHTLRQTAQLMSKRRVGSAVVVDPDGSGIGIITERDVLNAVGSGLDVDAERTAAHLTWDVVYAGPDWTEPAGNECVLPAQPLEEVRHVGRTWLKARDHDAELTANYGDWRTPEPGWDYMRGPAIVRRFPWDDSDHRWVP